MPRPRAFRKLRLLNGSTGDPSLFVDDQGRDNALLIDCGDNAVLGDDRLADLEACSRCWALIALTPGSAAQEFGLVSFSRHSVARRDSTFFATWPLTLT